jgi:hypothetical protein
MANQKSLVMHTAKLHGKEEDNSGSAPQNPPFPCNSARWGLRALHFAAQSESARVAWGRVFPTINAPC